MAKVILDWRLPKIGYITSFYCFALKDFNAEETWTVIWCATTQIITLIPQGGWNIVREFCCWNFGLFLKQKLAARGPDLSQNYTWEKDQEHKPLSTATKVPNSSCFAATISVAGKHSGL